MMQYRPTHKNHLQYFKLGSKPFLNCPATKHKLFLSIYLKDLVWRLPLTPISSAEFLVIFRVCSSAGFLMKKFLMSGPVL